MSDLELLTTPQLHESLRWVRRSIRRLARHEADLVTELRRRRAGRC